jgi:hypothetical protein
VSIMEHTIENVGNDRTQQNGHFKGKQNRDGGSILKNIMYALEQCQNIQELQQAQEQPQSNVRPSQGQPLSSRILENSCLH